ncbi:helix-turn-helix domain-containing protein [Flavobacterium sp. Root186]|uniref:helix-turn-helix domain-containing protein n=1 Tax=Flavobacterium sp. Root186 TaxID=1736485 RepID=UPI0006F60D2F|nr:helix-turn-helix domain-containing protein [Flavobacterium sp. Root186]KRB54705.1 DNA-binding protein [Flavobacterium sp. Root186]
METIQFLNYSPKQLQSEIAASVKTQLEEFLQNYQPQQPKEYLSRKNVAEMFGVDISTVHNWCKSKRLNPLGIGSRVYFLRSEVEASLTPLNG